MHDDILLCACGLPLSYYNICNAIAIMYITALETMKIMPMNHQKAFTAETLSEQTENKPTLVMLLQ